MPVFGLKRMNSEYSYMGKGQHLLLLLLFIKALFLASPSAVGLTYPKEKAGEKDEAGATFNNSFFDNYFDFLRQLKNGSFLGPVFVHVTGRS